MIDPIRHIEASVLTIQRDTPYLGALLPGEEPDARGYFVRKGSGTVYPTVDRSVLVRIETRDGVVGWGETYGIVAPRAVIAIIDDLLAGFTVGRDPWDVSVIHDELYDLMRVRGYYSGYYMDALAAIDIALWDICGKQSGKPLAKLLGGRRRDSIPAYVSGLPRPTLAERAEFAADWQNRGFNMFKTAGVASDNPPLDELAGLRERLGDKAKISMDFHWAYSAADAIAIIRSLGPTSHGSSRRHASRKMSTARLALPPPLECPSPSGKNGARFSMRACGWTVRRQPSCNPRWDIPASRNSCASPNWLRLTISS